MENMAPTLLTVPRGENKGMGGDPESTYVRFTKDFVESPWFHHTRNPLITRPLLLTLHLTPHYKPTIFPSLRTILRKMRCTYPIMSSTCYTSTETGDTNRQTDRQTERACSK